MCNIYTTICLAIAVFTITNICGVTDFCRAVFLKAFKTQYDIGYHNTGVSKVATKKGIDIIEAENSSPDFSTSKNKVSSSRT